MSVDIRQYTRVVIKKDGKYLFCMSQVTMQPEWRENLYDAWYTRDANIARAVAKALSADPMLFNPVVGKVALIHG